MSSFLALFVTTALGAAQADRPEVLAVFPIHDKSGASKASEIDQLSDLLANEIVRRTRWKVIPRGEIESLLRDEKKKSYKGCYDESCQLELGRELAANKVLKTQLLAIGKQCVLTSTLYDLVTAAADWAHTEKSGCASAELLTAVENIAAALGARGAETSATVSSALPADAPAETPARSDAPSNTSGARPALVFRGGLAVSPLVYFGEVSGSAGDLSWFRLNFGAGIELFDLLSFELQLAPLIPLAAPELEFLVVPGLRLDLGYVYAHTGVVMATSDGTFGIEASAGVRIADLIYAGPVIDGFFEGVVYVGLEVGAELEIGL